MELDKEILKGYIDSIILSLLEKRDLYGYIIAKEIRHLSNDNFQLKEATLYVALKRLESKNLIAFYWGENNNSNGGRRKYYKITDLGKCYLTERKKQWKFFNGILEVFFEGDQNEKNR